jgi:hypothetical protein
MALNKFIPLSPDPNITRDSDMGMAQFGHLNTIVDYLNGTNALTDIKIAGINNTPGYIDFSANPTGSTTIVGAIRTYVNGTTLSEVLQFREDGTIFGKGTQAANNLVIQQSNDVGNLYVYNSATWGLLTTTPNGTANTTFNGRIIGTHGGAGNSALALGTIQADTSGSNFNLSIGQASTITTSQNCTAIGRNTIITTTSNATAIGYNATTSTINAVAIGDSNALLQIGGNFVPTARVHVRGLGSTSATTSLLVQNSGGTDLLKVRDDGFVEFTNAGLGMGNLSISGLAYNAVINFGANDLSIGCNVANRRVNLYSGNTNVLTAYKSATNYGVGISDTGSEYPTPSAVLQADSITRGFLKPRLTTTQKNAIVTPAAGLEVFDTTLGRPCFYSGSAWVTL